MPRRLSPGRKGMSKHPKGKTLPRLLFLIYCVVMLWLLFGQRWGNHSALTDDHANINLIPFRTITQYISLLNNPAFRTHAFVNLAGNVLLFVPLGYLLPRIWKPFHLFFATVPMVAMMIILVEFLQYATGLGSCDIDDLILNISGAAIGYLIWLLKKT